MKELKPLTCQFVTNRRQTYHGMAQTPEHILKNLFAAAVERCHPRHCMNNLNVPVVSGQTIVVGAGKAAAEMALEYERQGLPCDRGLVIAAKDTIAKTKTIEVRVGGHPIPDQSAIDATKKIRLLASSLGPSDQLIVLLSGGGSALLCAPIEGLDLLQKQSLIEQLLRSGAPIDAINRVRKHISKVKGGRLAVAAYPAICHAFAISDVVGDDPAVIASGPTIADPTTSAQARKVLQEFHISAPRVENFLTDPQSETPKPGAQELSKSHFTCLATPDDALATATKMGISLGFLVLDLGSSIEGEAKEVAKIHADLALSKAASGQAHLILSGGELTVTKSKAEARGGPNHEYALGLALALDGSDNIFALAADTDGFDGNSGGAGAIVTPETLTTADRSGLHPQQMLLGHQSGHFFDKIQSSIKTGPTGTNVNDFRAMLVNPHMVSQ